MEAQRISGTCLKGGPETWAGKWVPKVHATRHHVLCRVRLSFSLHKKGLAGKVDTQKVRLASAMAVAAKVTKLASCAPQWVTAVAQELTIVVRLAHDRRSYFCVSFSPRSLANAGSQS